MRATEIAALLAQQVEQVCQHLLPNGVKRGHDWCCGGTDGSAGKSLKVRLDGSRAGVWADFGGSDEDRGDLIALWMRVRNCDLSRACGEALDYLNIPEDQRVATIGPVISKPIPTRQPSQNWLRLQSSLRPLTLQEITHLASIRRLPATAGLELATRHGHLFHAEVFDDGFLHDCWLITDSSRRNAQARRLDGKLFDGIKAKAKTISGCEANWPIGTTDIEGHDVALVEGGPDFLSAWHLIWFLGKTDRIRPVAMLGASQPIHPSALPLFAHKAVHIFPHSDDNLAGQKAGDRWWSQLMEVDARPTLFHVSQHGKKDLNELVASASIPE